MTDRASHDGVEYYDDYWENYWIEQRELPSRTARIVQEVIEEKGSEAKVLDVGCGDGDHYMKAVQPKVSEYHGIDISEEAVKRFVENGGEGVRQDVQEEFPYESKEFDVVFCFETLEHVFSPLSVLKNIRRVLKDDGVLIASVPNTVNFWNRIVFLLGYFNAMGSPKTGIHHSYKDPHIRFFSVHTLHNLFAEAKFKTQYLGGSGNASLLTDMPRLGKYFGWERRKPFCYVPQLLGYFFPSLFASNLTVVSHKRRNEE